MVELELVVDCEGLIVASSKTPIACKTLQTVKTSKLSPINRSGNTII